MARGVERVSDIVSPRVSEAAPGFGIDRVLVSGLVTICMYEHVWLWSRGWGEEPRGEVEMELAVRAENDTPALRVL